MDIQSRQFPIRQSTLCLRPGGDQGLVIPTGERDGVGQHGTGFMPLLQGVGSFGGVIAVETDGWLGHHGQLGLPVVEDQPMPGMGGIVPGHSRLIVLETEGQAFFGEQAAEERGRN